MLPAPIVTLADRYIQVQVPEVVFPYDRVEHEEWKKARCSIGNQKHDGKCVPVNARVVRALLSDLDLGEDTILNRGGIYHQTYIGNHYCEIKIARHLVLNCKFAPTEILYENWRLSSSSKALASQSGLQWTGTSQVRRCLGAAFLSEMSALIDANRNQPLSSFFPPNHRLSQKARLPTHDDHVDIYAFSRELNRCAILDAKCDVPRREQTSEHQVIFLAFAAYLLVEKRAQLGLPSTLGVDVGFVRFQSSPSEPRFLSVKFKRP